MARLTLKNGQWLEVKDKQRVRDRKDVHTYSVDGISSDGQTYRFNVVKHQIATAAARIKHWSLKDEFGKSIPWSQGQAFRERVEIIEGLDEDVFEEITDLLNTHLKAVEGEEDEEKKETPDGETPSTTNSSSVN